MAAAGAIQHRHLPDGNIQWLQVKPGCAPSDDTPRVVLLHCHGHRNCQRFVCIFCLVDFVVADYHG